MSTNISFKHLFCLKFKAVFDKKENVSQFVVSFFFTGPLCPPLCSIVQHCQNVSSLTVTQSSLLFWLFLRKSKVSIANTLSMGTLTRIVTNMKTGLG